MLDEHISVLIAAVQGLAEVVKGNNKKNEGGGSPKGVSDDYHQFSQGHTEWNFETEKGGYEKTSDRNF